MGLTRATLRDERRPALAPLATPQAVAALRSDDPESRRRGALALQGRADAADVLADALLAEDHLAVRDAMLLALRSADGAGVARVGAALLRRDEINRRITGVELLAGTPVAAKPVLGALLRDPDADLRALAATAAALGEVPLEPELLAALSTDPDAGARCALLEALRIVGGAATAAALRARYPEGAEDLEGFAAAQALEAAARRSGR
jgi:hypothetical protein